MSADTVARDDWNKVVMSADLTIDPAKTSLAGLTQLDIAPLDGDGPQRRSSRDSPRR